MTVPQALLSVAGLTRSFYGVQALRGVDFSVQPGTITALIGPNGAGKTTAFQCISGVIPPDGGTSLFAGRDITGWRPDRITSVGPHAYFQIARGIGRLSVLDNLMLYAADQPGERLLPALTGGGRQAEEAARCRAIEIARRLNLMGVANNPAGASVRRPEEAAGDRTGADGQSAHDPARRADRRRQSNPG